MIGCQGIQIGERATQQAQAFAANPPPGVTVDPGTLSVEGFPLAFTVESQAPSLRRADGLTWNAAGVVATARPWTLPEVGFTIAPPQRVTLPGSPALIAEVKGSGSGTARLGGDGKPTRVLLTLSQVELSGGLLPAALPVAVVLADWLPICMSVVAQPARNRALAAAAAARVNRREVTGRRRELGRFASIAVKAAFAI